MAANDDEDGSAPTRFFIFGCGYSAGHFAERVGAEAIEGVTTRSPEKAAHFAARGFTPFLFDGTHPGEGVDAALHRATHLLVSIPPGHDAPKGAPEGAKAGGAGQPPGDPALRWYRDGIVHGASSLRWIGYLSTVGVYGDHDGAWIDEEAALAGDSPRARERIAAEDAWRQVAEEAGVPLAILRLSGIYGPGRNAFAKLKAGTARRMVKPGQVFNRIHADDIAGSLLHLSAKGLGGIFNVTDDEPAPPQDVIQHAARLADVPVPPDVPFEPVRLSPMARSFWSENKRVSNAKLKDSGYALAHPTYREGLASLLGEAG